MTDAEIRTYHGHNGHECRVRIRRPSGPASEHHVLRYGSPDPTDRSMDYWQFLGRRSDVVRWIEAQAALAEADERAAALGN